MMKNKQEKMLELIRLINQFDENYNIQNAIDDEMYRLFDELNIPEKEQEDYIDFYDDMIIKRDENDNIISNVVYDKNGEIIGFKPFKKKEGNINE